MKNNSGTQIEHGRALLLSGRYADAILALASDSVLMSDDTERYLLLSECYWRLADVAHLHGAVYKLLDIAPMHPDTHYYMSLLCDMQGDDRGSELYIRGALDLDPNHASYWSQLAAIYIARQDWHTALSAADSGLAHDPNDSDCLSQRALCLTEISQHRQ